MPEAKIYTVTVTDVRRNFKKVRALAKKVKEPVIVLYRGKPRGVFIDFQTFITKYKHIWDKIKHNYPKHLMQ